MLLWMQAGTVLVAVPPLDGGHAIFTVSTTENICVDDP